MRNIGVARLAASSRATINASAFCGAVPIAAESVRRTGRPPTVIVVIRHAPDGYRCPICAPAGDQEVWHYHLHAILGNDKDDLYVAPFEVAEPDVVLQYARRLTDALDTPI